MFDFVAVTSHDWNLEGIKVGFDEKKLQIVIRKAKKVIIYISCGLSRKTDCV
jgi:hypothetical protein